MNFEKYLVSDNDQKLIKTALLNTYFRDESAEFLTSEYGVLDIEANVNQRYLRSLQNIVPWVSKHIDLSECNVIEIGCGTGSSTAAFARFAKKIHAYEIDKKSLEAAEERINILKIKNVDFNLVHSENVVTALQENHSNQKVDIILLFAVLEHMTIEERHSVLITSWNVLEEDGLLVVVETPNLLRYFDSHSSVLPFFHFLPSDLCALYSNKSPRDGFNTDFSPDLSAEERDLKMTRWGRGVSYHDFELTIGNEYSNYIVANGYEPEILSWFSVNLEEEILRLYINSKKIDIPDGFSRCVLNLIFKKSSFPDDTAALPDGPPISLPGYVKDSELQECQCKIQQLTAQIDEILNSKRWKIGNIIGFPYRFGKKILTGKNS